MADCLIASFQIDCGDVQTTITNITLLPQIYDPGCISDTYFILTRFWFDSETQQCDHWDESWSMCEVPGLQSAVLSDQRCAGFCPGGKENENNDKVKAQRYADT